MKNKTVSILIAIMLIFVPGAFAVESQDIKAGLTPDSNLYFLDKWSEGIGMALTFGNENKAIKHLEYAKERLSEMQEIKDNANIEDLQLNYIKQLQKSREKTQSQEFYKKIEDFESQNQEVLKQLRESLPEQSRKGIETAINNSQGAYIYSNEEQVQNRLSNQEMMMEKFLIKFEGKTFEVESETGSIFYRVEDNEIKEGQGDSIDYTIKIKDQVKAEQLYQQYVNGEIINYYEVVDTFEVPLKLQSSLVSIVGIGGLK